MGDEGDETACCPLFLQYFNDKETQGVELGSECIRQA